MSEIETYSLNELKAFSGDSHHSGWVKEWDVKQLQNTIAELVKAADGLAASKKCPNCDDVGWYGVLAGSPLETEQVQCQWCHTITDSRFNAITIYTKLKQELGLAETIKGGGR